MAAYSMDLRERVLRDSDRGLPSHEVAAKYSVSRAWVDRLKQRRRETGEVAPRKQTKFRTPISAPLMTHLAALIDAQPDRTLQEIQDLLRTPASLPTIWRAIGRLGYTVKINGVRVRTAAGDHRRGARRAAPGSSSSRRWIRPASSFSMRVASRPSCCAPTVAAGVARGAWTARPTATGRRVPSSAPCASPA